MGAAASKSKSLLAAVPTKKYDVFISFRGEDTRSGFTSHLRAHLQRKKVEVYMDDTLDKRDEISTALIQAIENSHVSLVILSENYAFSRWCLDELLKILECKNHDGQVVIPVFFEIDPSHVRKQIGSYGKAFKIHSQYQNKEKLQRWKTALTQVANFTGWDSRNYGDQYELIENIVNDILRKLDHIYPNELEGIVGIEEVCDHIEYLLSKVHMVGIWGMGGIGKTTIAKVVFANLSSQYEGSCFLENIREESQKHGLNYLRDKLLNELLKTERNHHTTKAEVIPSTFDMRRLSKKKVLIVLDDVASSVQLTCLASGYNCLSSDSRIIITSRDKQMLTSLGVDEIYEVKELNFLESLELFSLNAFSTNYPSIGFEELSNMAVSYAKGVPLALKVLGLYLHSKTKDEWESALAKLKKIPNKDIQNVLKLSYDGLNYEEKQIFLDIACFLNGERREHVINLMDSYGFYGVIGIRTLLDMALITISNDDEVWMHDMIQEVGWEIVHEDSIKEPGRRTRLWDYEEVYDVLKYNKGTDSIEGITLDVSEIRDLHLRPDTFIKMPNLRFLKVCSSSGLKSCKVYLPDGIESFSNKLGYFHWIGYPLPSLPPAFCAEKLVEFIMPNSHVEKLWDGVQDLVSLKRIDLRGSKQLMELPDFSKASKLERVNLFCCENLSLIHPSMLYLSTLVELNLCWCVKLRSLQSEIHFNSLEHLLLEGCTSLKEFSLSSEKITSLDLRDTTIEKLSPSIGYFSNLERLVICNSLKCLPNEFCNLKSLKELEIYNCNELDTANLHIILDGLLSLGRLQLSQCCSLSQLPYNISVLSSLHFLSLDGSGMESLPTSIKHLSCLHHLDISNCRRLRSLPELPPSVTILKANNCMCLEKVITSTTQEVRASSFYSFRNCVKLGKNSQDAIIKDTIFRIKKASTNVLYHCCNQVFLSAIRIPKGSIYVENQTFISMEIPSRSDLLGFAFWLLLSHEFLSRQGNNISSIGYQCYFEDKVVRCKSKLSNCYPYNPVMELISDHVFLWYSAYDSDAILEAIENSRANDPFTTSNRKLSFEFFVNDDLSNNKFDKVIKGCGVWPIYASEYQKSMNQMEVGDESKTCWQVDELGLGTIELHAGGSELEHEISDLKLNLQLIRQQLSPFSKLQKFARRLDHLEPQLIRQQLLPFWKLRKFARRFDHIEPWVIYRQP